MPDAPVAVPRWLLPVGIVLVVAGVAGFFADLRSGTGPVGDAFGSISLAVDLVLDGFLVVAGVVTLLVVRANSARS